MAATPDKLRGRVISQGDLFPPLGDNEWKVLSEAPRYTLEELLAQCDANAPEMEEVSEWQRIKPTGREQ